ncbi:MAG TPA: arginine--tRNA ligase [Coleofasciculaceae cyanobacterium]|jgi:arginyl-tRNA synthetase
MIRNRILAYLEAALEKAAPSLNGLTVDDTVRAGLKLERPRNPEHGDYAVNVSFLARHTKMAPPKIAEAIAPHLSACGVEGAPFEVQVVGGYLNLKLTEAVLREALVEIIHAEKPGRNDSLKAERILLEYVSANPTGPLHIGHGRWAALGDSLVRILRHCGAFVTPEFYINDAGVQMRNISESVFARVYEYLKETQSEDFFADLEIIEGDQGEYEPPYPGEYVKEMAIQLFSTNSRFREVLTSQLKIWVEETRSGGAPLAALDEVASNFIRPFVKDAFLGLQQALLNEMHVHFDTWISEKAHLYERTDAEGLSPIEATLRKFEGKRIPLKSYLQQLLQNKDLCKKAQNAGFELEKQIQQLLQDEELPTKLETLEDQPLPLIFEQDEATWFRSTAYGDEKDRVLRKSDGSFTYLTPDIAYHDDKFNRPEGYTRIMNIWGADHHGYIPRMRGAIAALGHDPEKFEVLLGQLVNLIVEGERTRMGKRRKMLTLQDVVEEVGVDATRFWMVSKSADSSLDFDVDLAASASSENPVFYVQYAHARCCSILRNAVEPAPNVDTGEMAPSYVETLELSDFECRLRPDDLKLMFDSLTEDREKAILKTLVLHLDNFENIVQDAARLRSPHFLTQYMMDLSANFHSFYGVCRILTPEPALTKTRLMLIQTIRKTLAQALALIGVDAPDKM